MIDDRSFTHEIEKVLPNLRVFARNVARNPTMADDLVQETLIKAWQHRQSFAAGSNLKAWLFTILRNTAISHARRAVREVADSDGHLAATLAVAPNQHESVEVKDLAHALTKLPREQREAILLVAAEGFSYEEAALMCGCAVGTVKSRVSRARVTLADLIAPANDQQMQTSTSSTLPNNRRMQSPPQAARATTL